jgi:hypothetical protein
MKGHHDSSAMFYRAGSHWSVFEIPLNYSSPVAEDVNCSNTKKQSTLNFAHRNEGHQHENVICLLKKVSRGGSYREPAKRD